MKAYLEYEIYNIHEHTFGHDYNANIYFCKGKFEKCEFIVNRNNALYDYDSWMFLRDVANEIERIQAEKKC